MSIEAYGEPSALFLLASDEPAAADNWMIKVVAEGSNPTCVRLQFLISFSFLAACCVHVAFPGWDISPFAYWLTS
jgi:hypothetical protein